MHTATMKPHRVGFTKARVSVGALLHAGSLAAAHLLARRWKNPLAKVATYGAFTIGAGFACKLLHERETRHEKELLAAVETAL